MEQRKNIFRNNSIQRKRKRVYSIFSLFIALFIMVFAITPYIVKSMLLDWLSQQGATNSAIDDVDFNYFTSTLELEKLYYEYPGHQPLTIKTILVNLDWLPLISNKIFVKEVQLHDANINVTLNQEGKLTVNGLGIPPKSDAPDTSGTPSTTAGNKPWQFGIANVNITNSRIDYEQPDLKSVFNINSFTLSELTQWLPGQSTLVNGSMLVNNAPLEFEGSFRPFGDDKPLQLKLSGKNLDLVPFERVLHSDQLKLTSGSLNLDINIDSSFAQDNLYNVKVSGNVSLNNSNLQLADMRVDFALLGWDGASELVINKFSNKTSVFSKGTINANSLQLEDLPSQTLATVNQFTWAGTTSLNTQPGSNEERAHVSGASSVSGLEVVDTSQNLVYASLDLLDIPGFEFSMDKRLEIPDIILANTKLLGNKFDIEQKKEAEKQDNLYLSTIKKFIVKDVTVNFGDGILVNTVTISDVDNQLIRTKDGKLLHIAQLSSPERNKKAASTAISTENKDAVPATSNQQAGKSKSILDNIKIGTIKSEGENRFFFKDYSVKPFFETSARNIQFKINALDSTSSDNRAQMEFLANVDEQTKISVKGNIQPFTDKPAYDLKAQINSLELYPLSPYAANAVGYNIKRGSLSLDSTIKIKNQLLASKNKIFLKNLNFTKVDDKKAASFSDELPMTLEASLDLLRDDKNNIDLSIPVNGSLDNPDFKLTSVINKAVSSSLQSSMIAYLSYALQPWGALIYAGNLAAGSMQKLTLSPIEFKSGQKTISADTMTYIDKIATLMKKKPDLTITLCGVTTIADRDTLLKQSKNPKQEISENDMLALAKQRAKSVRIYLIKNKNIDPGKISNCKPTYRTAKNTKPSVEIIL